MLGTKSFTVTIKRAGWKPLVLTCGSGGSDLRGQCVIEEGGGTFKETAEIFIYGVNADHLKNYSSLGLHRGKTVQIPETITVSIGKKIIFVGDSYLTRADFSDYPDIGLKISAVFGFSASMVQHDNTYIKASQNIRFQDAARKLVNELNKDLGLSDPNARIALQTSAGLKALSCPDMILTGTALHQLMDLADAMGLRRIVDHRGAFFWEDGKTPPAYFLQKKPVMKAEIMKGYPIFTNEGVQFTTAEVGIYTIMDKIKLESSVPYATGTYYIDTLRTELSTLPNGRWETTYVAFYDN